MLILMVLYIILIIIFDVVSEIKYSSFKDSVINPNFRSLALNDKDPCND